MSISIADLITTTDDLLSFEPMWDKTKSVHEWLHGVRDEMRILRGKAPHRIFAEFTVRLLAGQTNEKAWWQKTRDMLQMYSPYHPLEFKEMWLVLKHAGYRFPPRGANVIVEARNVWEYMLDYDWEKYFIQADYRARDGFLDDYFLTIKGVGRKTRDLALTDFTLQYPVIDVHIRRVMSRTGLAGDVDVDLTKYNPSKKEYDALRERCYDLSGENGLMAAELDRLFWHFGKTVCKKTPLCEKCLLGDMCPGSEKAKHS